MVKIVNISRIETDTEPDFMVEAIHRQLTAISEKITGSFTPTIWKRVTGYPELMVVTGFESLESQEEYEKLFLMTPTGEATYELFRGAPNVDRFKIEIHQGCGPGQAPIDGYLTFNSHQADLGHAADELEEARYSIDSMSAVDGFIGAVAGTSIIVPGRIESMIFWANREAVEQSIPIRVDTNLRMYRKMV